MVKPFIVTLSALTKILPLTTTSSPRARISCSLVTSNPSYSPSLSLTSSNSASANAAVSSALLNTSESICDSNSSALSIYVSKGSYGFLIACIYHSDFSRKPGNTEEGGKGINDRFHYIYHISCA